MRINYLTVLLLVSCNISVFSQGDAVIKKLYGDPVHFYINSFNELTNGKTLSEYSYLRVSIDTVGSGNTDTYTGWSLKVRSTNTSLVSDYGSDNIPTTYITITSLIGGVPQVTVSLTTGYQEIAQGSDLDGTETDIKLTLSCGAGTGFLGWNMGDIKDHFDTELDFLLEAF